MAYKCVILQTAHAELEEIIEYLIGATGGTNAASSLLNELDKAIGLASEFPTMYRFSRLSELAKKGYRTIFFASYVVLYRFENELTT